MDSLAYFAPDPESRVDGYSKDLDNYNTIILLNKSRNEESVTDSIGKTHLYVWHRKGIDFAYPAKKEDKTLLARKIFYQKATIPFFWLFSILITFIMHKIIKKSKLFKGFDH